MNFQFGNQVKNEALRLEGTGKDPNQIANILCKQDSQGHNYGIGIVLDGNGQAMPSSPTLLDYVMAELEHCLKGNYLNSAEIMEDLTKNTLKWQRIPEKYWKNFKLALPSDAGTGAVQTGVRTTFSKLCSTPALGDRRTRRR